MERFESDRDFINQRFESMLRHAANRYDVAVEHSNELCGKMYSAKYACGDGNCGKVKREAYAKLAEEYHTQIMWRVHYSRVFEDTLELWSDILNKWYEDDLQWAVDEMFEGQVEERMLERAGIEI